MVAAEPELLKLAPDVVVDAKVGRQLVEAMDILRRLEREGKLYDTVVIGLGSNLPFTVEEGSEVLDFLGEDRTIYWVNTFGRYLDWQDEVNGTISELGEIYDNVTVLDWSAVAPDNPEWIRSDDGIHLTPEGTVGYVDYWAIVEGTDEYDLACEWINWIESEEQQTAMATGISDKYPGEYYTYTPVNAKAIDNLTPEQKITLELDPMPTCIKLLPYIADPELKDAWTDLYQEFVG